MPRDDLIEMRGKILDAMGGGKYKIQTEGQDGNEGSKVIAQLAGRLRRHTIRVLPGDTVLVSVSPYDLSNGLITYRGDQRPQRRSRR